MLTIGKDSYVTNEEAAQYVSEYYTATDPLRIAWEALSTDDQDVYLRKAFRQINALPYTGRPKDPKQSLPFPRKENFESTDMQSVKYAQIAQAVSYGDLVKTSELSERALMRRAGVIEYSIGDLREKFVDGLPADSAATFYGLDKTAFEFLSKWVCGGYKVCTSIKKRHGWLW